MLPQQMGPSLEDIPVPWGSPETQAKLFYSPHSFGTSLNNSVFSTKAAVMPHPEGDRALNRPTMQNQPSDGSYIQVSPIFPSSTNQNVCCANPVCSFLVHSDPGIAWAFCCASCEFHYFSRNIGNTLLSTPCSHDDKCQAGRADMLLCRPIIRAQPISSSIISPAFNKSWSGVCGAHTLSQPCSINTQSPDTCSAEDFLDEIFDDRAEMEEAADGESTFAEPPCAPQQPAFQMQELVPSSLLESTGADEIEEPSTPPPPPTPPPPEMEEEDIAPDQDLSMLPPPPPPPPLEEDYDYAFDALPQPPPPPYRPTDGARNKHLPSKMDTRSKNRQMIHNHLGIGRWRAGRKMEATRNDHMPFQ